MFCKQLLPIAVDQPNTTHRHTPFNYHIIHYNEVHFMSIPYEQIPLITNIVYLRAHDLLISFDNGEDRVIDMTDCFDIPPSMPYYPINEFKKFMFDNTSIWWGPNTPDQMSIGHDSLYNMSMPIPVFTSSMFLSMGVVDHRTEPFEGWIRIVGREEQAGHKEPHAHVEYHGKTYVFALCGGLLVEDSRLQESEIKMLDDWVQKNRKAAVDMWNQWNPTLQADPSTGKRVQK